MLAIAETPIRSSEIARAYMDKEGIAGRDPHTCEFYRSKVTNVLFGMRKHRGGGRTTSLLLTKKN